MHPAGLYQMNVAQKQNDRKSTGVAILFCSMGIWHEISPAKSAGNVMALPSSSLPSSDLILQVVYHLVLRMFSFEYSDKQTVLFRFDTFSPVRVGYNSQNDMLLRWEGSLSAET